MGIARLAVAGPLRLMVVRDADAIGRAECTYRDPLTGDVVGHRDVAVAAPPDADPAYDPSLDGMTWVRRAVGEFGYGPFRPAVTVTRRNAGRLLRDFADRLDAARARGPSASR